MSEGRIIAALRDEVTAAEVRLEEERAAHTTTQRTAAAREQVPPLPLPPPHPPLLFMLCSLMSALCESAYAYAYACVCTSAYAYACVCCDRLRVSEQSITVEVDDARQQIMQHAHCCTR